MMNIEHIKSLSLKDYLANKGHYPVKEYTTYGMYRDLFREESSPSFKVDYRANLWYDFGSGEGGSIIDLVMKLHGCTLSQAIGLLENRVEIGPLTQNDFERQVERREEMKIIEAVSTLSECPTTWEVMPFVISISKVVFLLPVSPPLIEIRTL
ncbi:CHC2 zinc finger domain-containing protein [Porphyromonas sp. COT-108 OH2963]|uniref:CHC2 zinc finger domain-containing protein n=1 Tax=Porphyromonas sp. COT-108 OH2963 TaxID=1515614 RepID=UPI001F464449|nr:CHC2 zinc finger domain-containing protein [Porphyromonas sp. COT-108 OH2963]